LVITRRGEFFAGPRTVSVAPPVPGFVCQDFSAVAMVDAYSGTAVAGMYSGTAVVDKYSATYSIDAHSGSATICGR